VKVLLGPSHELHVGVHGSLLATPPDGVTYTQGRYVLRLRAQPDVARPFSPMHDPAIDEWVRFVDVADDVEVVHSSRLPVQTALPWVVDADSLLATLQVGRFFALGAASRGDPPLPSAQAVAGREAAMVARYVSQRCTRILFRTEYARRGFLDHLAAHAYDRSVIDVLAFKSDVVYPAVPSRTRNRAPGEPVEVLYSGRTSRDKGAATATDVFGRLRARHGEGVRLTFVGPCPDDLEQRLHTARAEVVPVLTRTDYLDRVDRADIFLSPTDYESVGMALIEAAAAGCAIVCSAGPGMEHVSELLTDGEHALFVSNAHREARRTDEFTAAVSTLIGHPELRARLSAANRIHTDRGRLSLRQRDARLLETYRHAASTGIDPAAGVMTSDDHDPDVLDWPEQICHWSDQRAFARIGGRVSITSGATSGSGRAASSVLHPVGHPGRLHGQ